MNYKESNMQSLSSNLKKLLDDPEITSEEVFELIVLTVGENINTHRDAMNCAKNLRDKLMGETGVDSIHNNSSIYDSIFLKTESDYWSEYKKNEN